MYLILSEVRLISTSAGHLKRTYVQVFNLTQPCFKYSVLDLCQSCSLVCVVILQETYPHTSPIWFAESDDAIVSAAIEKLCETTPDNYNVSDRPHI